MYPVKHTGGACDTRPVEHGTAPTTGVRYALISDAASRVICRLGRFRALLRTSREYHFSSRGPTLLNRKRFSIDGTYGGALPS